MLLTLAILLAAALLVDLFTILFFAKVFGLKIRKISYGVGFIVYENQTWTIRVFPLSSSVAFQDSVGEEVIKKDSFFEEESKTSKILIALSGCLVLLLVSWSILGDTVILEFFSWMWKILAGPFLPTQEKVEYFSRASDYVKNNAIILVFANVCFFVAVFNLMPMPHLYGGRFILELVKNQLLFDKIFLIGFSYWLIIIFSWIYPFLMYLLV